ncbi:MAG: threonylcarbamoyl-AMP synthase [Muribaculaceae bacterium]|jgi:tRNA threonylcarbamoyl adenosine modification protein (Sua5/YciO/YrdC/YwlC family)|nr:threonylcarbamoyl-AMP synthase [Muribaculaceae bacterium]MBQ2490369.1 threonylcarbamoyl-AMP synthase [Muribaculaceae bacterium]MBQ3960868.1 threonylcarbamoyl-AMP synthase [Muribaculaceae bacterium]MBQ4007217.1 threonylcarbamoyl-AMP synthase [Muribaculaceae bacterium]
MKVLSIIEDNINQRFLDEVVETLRDGGIVIYPTDTIYAIGCDALNNQAIERICAMKSMKSAKTNLSIICHDISDAAEYAKFDNNQFKMMKRNLPGPFTFIFPALSKLPKAFKGRRTVGIRIPDNIIARTIVENLGRPILSTSVMGQDEDYISEPELIAENYANTVDIVIDAGRGKVIPSTVVDCTSDDFEIVRQGIGELIY